MEVAREPEDNDVRERQRRTGLAFVVSREFFICCCVFLLGSVVLTGKISFLFGGDNEVDDFVLENPSRIAVSCRRSLRTKNNKETS